MAPGQGADGFRLSALLGAPFRLDGLFHGRQDLSAEWGSVARAGDSEGKALLHDPRGGGLRERLCGRDGGGRQALLPLCRFQRAPLSAPSPERIGEEVRRSLRCGLGCPAREAARAPGDLGATSRQMGAEPPPGARARVGFAERCGSPVGGGSHGGLRGHGGGVGQERGPDRRPSRSEGIAGEHVNSLYVRQRRVPFRAYAGSLHEALGAGIALDLRRELGAPGQYALPPV